MRGLTLKVCAFRFFDTFLLIVPFYTVMFAERGLSPAEIGTALAAWSATGLVLEIPAGVLADRTSRRWLLFAGQALRALGFLVWIIAPGFWGYLIGLVLWGLKSALMNGTFEALVYDELAALGASDQYARTIGRAHAARWAGFLAASLAAAATVHLGYDALLAASLAAAALSSGAALTLPGAPRTRSAGRGYFEHLGRGLADVRRLPGVAPLLLFIAGMQGIITACEDYWQLFGQQVGLAPAQIALFVAALGGASALSSGLAHRGRHLSVASLYALLTAAGVVLVAASAAFQPWSVYLLIPFLALIRAVDINFDARFQDRLAPATRATVASVKGFAAQSATTVLILGFGVLAQLSAYRAAFLAYGAALTVLGGAFALRSLVSARSPPAPRPP